LRLKDIVLGYTVNSPANKWHAGRLDENDAIFYKVVNSIDIIDNNQSMTVLYLLLPGQNYIHK